MGCVTTLHNSWVVHYVHRGCVKLCKKKLHNFTQRICSVSEQALNVNIYALVVPSVGVYAQFNQQYIFPLPFGWQYN